MKITRVRRKKEELREFGWAESFTTLRCKPNEQLNCLNWHFQIRGFRDSKTQEGVFARGQSLEKITR